MTDTGSAIMRRELGDFLRSRRERLTPEQVGLPSTGRRRTPGLRREEAAVLAGVGVTWYTWLEQGRAINVSMQVVTAIGRALRLDDEESQHLLRLAGMQQAELDAVACDPALLAAFQPVLDKLDPYPACLQTPLFSVIAYNRTYRHLFTDMDAIPAEDRNCAVKFFTDPSWRDRYVDADVVATRMVARMRAAVSSGANGSETALVIDRLLDQSDEFMHLWRRHDVLLQHYDVKRIDSPLVGRLSLSFVSTQVAETGHRLTIMTPEDGQTRDRLEQLSALASEPPPSTVSPRRMTAPLSD
ncbi:transcriptional regulator with XRE-family HTH domain [Microbacterium resistens]|uniref:Transcriptional regulator with XRE-family HTH domain n=1 Tax=Microbacterium resistens TaxID=156977 RepID=A0ABU1SDK4_9MICO|nr:helix-turn-helix transcriptional regulator [Microbacterium resistens]MDR6866977.1 transcriptional regulator with XRE-family HTH domain [Microbacterium resistens]